jgi:hypothetical protein
MRCSYRAFLGVILLLLLLAQMVDAQNIRVLVVSNTGDDGKGRQATIDDVRALFEELVPSHRYTIDVLESARDNYTADSVLRAIRELRVAQEDTFVFFFHGHGGRDQRNFGGREHHFLSMPDGGRLWSVDLQETVKAKPCHLRLILTASCNTSVQPSYAMEPAMDEWDVRRGDIAPVMERLFLDHHGLLHMNGSYPGQYHFSDDAGAWFFQCLFGYIRSNLRARPTWRSVDSAMDAAMNEKFQMAKQASTDFRQRFSGQDRLVPVGWSYPELGRGGATAVPERLSLEPGDVILTINGQQVSGRNECILAVNGSPRIMTFTVRDRRNGTVWEMQTELRDGGMRFGVDIVDNGGDGARVTHVQRGAPCTKNRVLGKVN